MRWDALELNPGGLTNDGRNWVPLPIAAIAERLDISTAIRDTLSTNVTTALQASKDAITAVWEDAKTAQASAQTLYDEATSDLAIRRTLMEASAASSALADTACTNANNAMNAANGVHATASTQSQTHINTADREIAIIMSLKAKLTEVRPFTDCLIYLNAAPDSQLFTHCSSKASTCKPLMFRRKCAVESWQFKILSALQLLPRCWSASMSPVSPLKALPFLLCWTNCWPACIRERLMPLPSFQPLSQPPTLPRWTATRNAAPRPPPGSNLPPSPTPGRTLKGLKRNPKPPTPKLANLKPEGTVPPALSAIALYLSTLPRRL